jgi:hypothetical protein
MHARFFKMLSEETEPSVRIVLGDFIFRLSDQQLIQCCVVNNNPFHLPGFSLRNSRVV